MASVTTTPIINQDTPFKWWNMSDIYNPNDPSSTGVYVPNVNDAIMDWNSGLYRVTSVDYISGVSVWQSWTAPASSSNDVPQSDLVLGPTPANISQAARAFINPAVTPSTLDIDSHVYVRGSMPSYCKVFLGTDTSSSGTVISKFFDSNGNLLGENIPLELAETETGTVNVAVKVAGPGYTTTAVTDGELLTVVFYNDIGGPIYTQTLLAQNTNFIRQGNASAKYVASIAVKSDFLSSTDDTIIEYPQNMPVAALDLVGVVTYTDGSTATYAVDGTKFSMLGLDNFIATQTGATARLVLSYRLSTNERTYLSTATVNGMVTAPYTARVGQMQGVYTVKLFSYPVWTPSTSSYSLRHFLYNLDRTSVYDVTSLVSAAGSNQAFNPTLYNTVQNLAFAVNMSDVDPSFVQWRFVQTMQITLLRQGTDTSGDPWTVATESGQDPVYGLGVSAQMTMVSQDVWNMDLTCGLTDQTAWLNLLYAPIHPLTLPAEAGVPPTPNVMAVIVNGIRTEIPVSKWNQVVTLQQAITIGDDVYIEWISRASNVDQQLGVSALVIRQVQAPAQ